MFKIIAQLLSQIFSFGEKAIKPEEVRIKNNQIKEPLKEKHIKEKLERLEKKDWIAYIEVISPKKNRSIKKLIRNLTEFGAEIQHIEIQDDYLFVKYRKDGQEQSSRFKL